MEKTNLNGEEFYQAFQKFVEEEKKRAEEKLKETDPDNEDLEDGGESITSKIFQNLAYIEGLDIALKKVGRMCGIPKLNYSKR